MSQVVDADSPTAGVVATAHPDATHAGVAMLRAGGNAMDAAVAAAWALGVCEPSGSGLGGQTLMMVHRAGQAPVILDGHSYAPAGVRRRTVRAADQRRGYRATTVPTTPATLDGALSRFGRLRAAQVMEPAIALAADGYRITSLQTRQLTWCTQALGATAAAGRFLQDGRPYRPGTQFRQPELARCLRRLADIGVRDFYEGEIARAIVDDMARHGGLITLQDLLGIHSPVPGPAVMAHYAGHRVWTAPPPGGGIEVLFGLALMDAMGPVLPIDDPESWYLALARASYGAFLAREANPITAETWSGDTSELLDPGRVEEFAARVSAADAIPVGVDAEGPGETTHVSVMDGEGMTVLLTQSIQSLFGAKVANDRYGFLYNNYLTTAPRGVHPYRLRGGGPVRSNAAPTLVESHDGLAVWGLGAAGSRRIVTSLLHCITGIVDGGLDLVDAVAAPRVHARLSRRVWVESPSWSPELEEGLEARGFTVERRPRHSYTMGCVQAVHRFAGTLHGAADPRREGTACRA